MDHLGKALLRFATNALAGRIPGNQLRVRGLQPLEFLHQAVKLGVWKFGGVQDVVEMFVMADGFAQLVDLALNGPIFGGSSHNLIIFRKREREFGLAESNTEGTRKTRPYPSLYVLREGPGYRRELDFGIQLCRAFGERRETLVAVGTGVAIFADLFLCPLARQGLLHAAFFTRLQIIRVPLYLFNDVFRLDLAFKPAQRVF